MKAEELHKAAEEWIASAFGKHPGKTLDEILPGSVNQFSKDLTAFHLHQTKKMLEGWTDEKIMAFVSEDEVLSPHEYGMLEGAKDFRDELLKQLEG